MPSSCEVYMIKECNVITRNDKVSVVLFDDKKIQIPTNKSIKHFAYIQFNKGNYTVVSKEEYDKEKANESIKNRIQKKNNENLVMDNEE